MGAPPYMPGQFDPSTQQPSVQPQAAPQQSAQPSQDEQALRQSLVQQATPPPQRQSGGIKGLLTNFLQGFGNSALKEAGLPTQYDIQQRALQNLNTYDNNQAMLRLHENMAQQLQLQPVQLADGSTVHVAQKDVAGLLNRMMQSGTAQNVAQTNVAGREAVARINQGMMMPIPEELRQQLGLPEGTTQLPLKQFQQAIGAATKPLTTLQGEKDQFQYNRLSGKKTATGVGNPRIAAAQAGAQARAAVTPFETVVPGTNIPTTISNLQAVQQGAPKVPIGTQMKMGAQAAQFNDANGILDNIDKLVGTGQGQVNLEDPAVRARVTAGYAAIKEPSAKGMTGEILSNFLARQPIFANLKPEERSLIIAMGQGKAAATGLRGIMGQAGSNEMQQRLDSSMFPGAQAAGSNDAIKQQTQAMRGMLGRFQVGQVQAGLNAPVSKNVAAPQGATGGFAAWKAGQTKPKK